MTSVSEIDTIIDRASHGDETALGQALQFFRSRLKQSVAMRMDQRLYGRIDPSDVVQETFLDAARRLREFAKEPERMPLLLWIRLLAVQRLVDLHRQHLGAKMRDVGLEVPLEQPGALQASSVWMAQQLIDRGETGSTVAMREELCQQVHEALNDLDPVDREVLAMRHFELLSNREVSIALDISPTAASNRYIRALRRLKGLLASLSADE